LLFLFLTAFVAAQPHVHPTPPASAAIIEVTRRPVPLRTGIGTAHDAVGTSSKPAQAFYDQGLAYLHSYVWLEAARSFNQALTLDPGLAIAHAMLSIAYTELNAPAAAREALARAQALASKASDHDRQHIAARALQATAETAGQDAAGAALAAYRSALDRALAGFPDDDEFWLLRGLAESTDPAERGQGTGVASVRFYEKALALAGDHFAGHHYLTHAYENTGRTNDALAQAATYAKMAPGVPHARHMHGHDLRRSGKADEAIAEFTAADSLSIDYFRTERIPVEYDWHYQHNLDLLATTYQYVGRMAQAESLLKRSFAIPSSLVAQEFNKREWPVFLLARGRVAEALDAATVMAGHRSPVVSAAGHVMLGHVRLAMRQYQAAADEGNAALRLMRGAMGGGMVADALQAFQGEFLVRTGQREKGRAMLEEVARKIRAAPGPDAWSQAMFALEGMARAAREAGDWDLAGWAARQMVEHDPNYGGAHFAQALVFEHEQNAKNRAEFELAAKLWKDADPGLPEMDVIKRSLR